MSNRLLSIYLIPAVCSLLFFCAAANSVPVPQEIEQTRRLWDSEFFKPQSKKGAAKRHYRNATPNISPERVDGDTVLGITLWRLRPSNATDDKRVRLLKHPKDETTVLEWTPERINTGTPLAPGQRVRLSIEAARSGYLYVVDRELYADGSVGDSYLIFPTLSILNGDNRLQIGRMVDLPGQNDSPNYFKLEPSRSDQVGEIIYFIVSPQPLDGIQLGEKEIPISKETLADWERSWGAQIGRMDLENAAGWVWSREEKESAANLKPLKYNSPAPQSLYYRPGAKASDPLLVKLQLRYGKTANTAKPKN